MGAALRFLLGDQPRELPSVDPTMTVLQYLRTVERRCGTKEGCAEGDCGACTVVLAELAGESLRYRAVNACIQFLPTLDGKQLLTVEDLAEADGTPHPVQQAMATANASQCGFCTPGFVMSLFALHHQGEGTAGASAADVLAGNLCRCTGYGPILQAAQEAAEQQPDDRFARQSAATVKALKQMQSGDTLTLSGAGKRYFAPRSLEALVALLREHPKAHLVAGSTDVGLWVTKQHRQLDTVIYLGSVPELARIKIGKNHIEIGAAVTYSSAASLLAHDFPDFGEILRRLGSVQIRNLGTIGGNIANGSPIGDSPPPLIAAGAHLILHRGLDRREISLEDYFLAYGKQDRQPEEFVESIRVPLPDRDDIFRCYKISKRFDQDISALLGAFKLRLDTEGQVADIRICYGGMAGTPKRALACEAALIGQPWGEATVEAGVAALAKDYQPLTDHRASADYRMTVAGNLLRKLYLESSGPSTATRVLDMPEPQHV